MSGDSLRNTLDHLALDPNAGTDRHYLVTVLRRLGYSEKEIRRVLGDEGEDSRVIEVEYTGGGKSFLFGQPGSEQDAADAINRGEGGLTFTMAGEDGEPMQFKLAGDDDAGTESFDAVELGDGDIGDDWGDDWGESDFSDEFTDGSGGFSTEDDGELVEFGGTELVQFREKKMNLVPFTMEGDEDPALAAGWVPVEDGKWEDVTDDYAIDGAPADAWQPVDEDAEWAESDDAWSEADDSDDAWAESPPSAEAFTYEDYTLYTRPVELTTGKTQQIYFFAKTPPKSGEPCALPEGYEVGVSEKTGLPFLRKIRADGETDPQMLEDTADNGPVADGSTWSVQVEKSQCGAITVDNKQCRLTAQAESPFCHIHQDYVVPTAQQLRNRLDTAPAHDVADTLPGEDAQGKKQCAAVTNGGMQCRNTAREWSLYCGSHKSYHPQTPMEDTDTLPVGSTVRDTLPITAEDYDYAEPETTFGMDEKKSGGRVRIKKVVANSREEAEAQVAREGGKVRSVVPVRVEEHDE